jgi:hypothetical protein
MSQLPPPIIRSRTSLCGDCKCDIDKSDPCSSCPKNKWGPVMCEFLDGDPDDESATGERVETNFPSVTTLASNFVTSVKDEVKARVTGGKKIEKEEIDRRLTVCRECEFFHAPSQRCKKCGCFLAWKTAWRSQKCPIGKW